METDGRGITVYRWLITVLGIGFLMLTGNNQGSVPLFLVALYAILSAVVEATRIEFEYGSLSLSSSVVLAALVTIGVPAALTVAAASYLLSDILRRCFSTTTLFNSAQAVLAGLGAAFFYHRLGGLVGGSTSVFLLPQFVFLGIYFLLNHSLVGMALLLGKTSISLVEYKSIVLWDLLAALLAFPIGMYMVQVYERLGLWALGLAVIPLVTLSYVVFLYYEVSRAHQEIMKIYRATRKIGVSIELDTTLNAILTQAKRLATYDQGLVYLIDGQTLMPAAHIGPVSDVVRYKEVGIGQGLVGTAGLRRAVMLAPSDDDTLSKECNPGEYQIAVPLLAGDRLVGVLALKRGRTAFKYHEVQYISIIAGQAATALENARLYSEVAALARLDSLTGILNRRTLLEILIEELDRCRRYDLRLSVLMVDLDNFKKINDAYGHVAGDAMLQKITSCVQALTRSVDTVGRYGGDEIVVILPETGPVEAFSVAERICQAVRELQAGETLLTVTTSIGIAGYPQHGDSAEQLLVAADQAMYQAKQSGGNKVLSFSQLLPAEIEIASALDNKS